jgi:hypothetical protein
VVFDFATSCKKSDEQVIKKRSSTFFSGKIDFAEEEVPLNIADVKERFDRELIVNTNYHSYTILALKEPIELPVIEPILKKNGVPDDFKYLAVIERVSKRSFKCRC